VDRMAEFVVDVKGECGDLFVDVRGLLILILIIIYYLEMILTLYLLSAPFQIIGKAEFM